MLGQLDCYLGGLQRQLPSRDNDHPLNIVVFQVCSNIFGRVVSDTNLAEYPANNFSGYPAE